MESTKLGQPGRRLAPLALRRGWCLAQTSIKIAAGLLQIAAPLGQMDLWLEMRQIFVLFVLRPAHLLLTAQKLSAHY
jgi:hypothetical protein